MVEDRFRRHRSLRAKPPANRQWMTLGNDSLARDAGRHGRVEKFRDLRDDQPGVHATLTGVNSDSQISVGEQLQRSMQSWFVKWNRRGRRRRTRDVYLN